ncbi:hypothetical protein [Actinoplanes subtropicus]|uniref:hypothetical protein n=1 Tax=Actinoplanes subtropicus TaxID=543632 RepID=UPI001FE16862|nr:hypothetical protein [Actinoplanes subtropicus]
MHLTYVLMSAVVTVSVAGASYAAMNPERAERNAREVASQATCRTVDSAIVAYVGLHDEAPRQIDDLTDFVDGDISRYRIVGGLAAGPGCRR